MLLLCFPIAILFEISSNEIFYLSCADYMYGSLQLSRTDAVAMAIQRGRDFGLASYNQIRESLNVPPIQTWGEINPNLNKTNPEVYTVNYILVVVHSFIKCNI